MTFLKKFVIPPLLTVFYWIWTSTWRLRLVVHPKVQEQLDNGRQLAFAHVHSDNLVLARLGRRFHIASLASKSTDGELITRVLTNFGFAMARGSSRRGGVHGLMTMMSLVKEGRNPAIAVDGPKGPPNKVKPGIIYVAQYAHIDLVALGVAKSSALVFNKAWDKTHLPWPFAKVVVSFGKPESPGEESELEAVKIALEKRLLLEREFAEAKLKSWV